MIKPTIGRVVLVSLGDGQEQWYPASICYVHSDTLINVAGVKENGKAFARTSLELRQDFLCEDPVWIPEEESDRVFACWMPHQRAQTQKITPSSPTPT